MRIAAVSLVAGLFSVIVATSAFAEVSAPAIAKLDVQRKFEALDLFDLEYVAEPQISPNGKQVVYRRIGFDVMEDIRRSSFWLVDVKSGQQQPLVDVAKQPASPRWSKDGKKLAFIANADFKVGGSEGNQRQIFVRYMDSGNTSQITQLTQSPSNLSWSPNGDMLAFTQFVATKPINLGEHATPPKGAKWAKPAAIYEDLVYRRDGGGYVKQGNNQVFTIATTGGSPRQVTTGFPHYGTISWAVDAGSLYYASNYDEQWQHDRRNSEVYELDLKTLEVTPLTSKHGPDHSPVPSPDGKHLAYLSATIEQGYRVTQLYIRNLKTGKVNRLSEKFDRDVSNLHWHKNSKTIYLKYVDKAVTKLASIDLKGNLKTLAEGLGGNSLGRPYSSGSYSVSDNGVIAFTKGDTDRPADLYTMKSANKGRQLTHLNENFLAQIKMGAVEEIWYPSSVDGLMIQGWIIKPHEFDPAKKYPLILEIHGGPYTSYAKEFTAELQLFASAGYVVLYANPRGSTSYGEAFSQEIYKAYPGKDYDDLMSGVDEVLNRGYINADELFVTGGSGGGTLTAWIVGSTNRFRAAVSAKPVINWYAFTFTSDIGSFFYDINFEKLPWEDPMGYYNMSPISLIPKVETPTMLLTGEADYRTPMSESEQYYQALKLRGVDTALVRIPNVGHSITGRPSNLLRKSAYILGWFERYRDVK